MLRKTKHSSSTAVQATLPRLTFPCVWGRTPRVDEVSDRFWGSFTLPAVDDALILGEQSGLAVASQTGHADNGHEMTIERPGGV